MRAIVHSRGAPIAPQPDTALIYALSLLLKKVSVYLCSKQSSTSMLYISPQTLPSWQLIDSYCNSSKA